MQQKNKQTKNQQDYLKLKSKGIPIKQIKFLNNSKLIQFKEISIIRNKILRSTIVTKYTRGLT